MAIAVLVASVLAFVAPQQVQACLPMRSVPVLLGVVMFGMGLTLRAGDFLPVVTHPLAVGVGVGAQFVFMPMLAVMLAKVLDLPAELALGVVLVGCCPGGTASNVISYLAKGDVALSVAMTSVSTLLAPIVTPVLVMLCASRSIEVEAFAMAWSVVQVVILPVVLGVLANEFFPWIVDRIRGCLPAFSSAVVVLIVAAVMAANRTRILESWGLIIAAVVIHNLTGMVSGWGVGWLFRLDDAKRRTLAIEVGMQNSGLAVSLASQHFASQPLAAVPGALFSVWHNISGSLFAAFVRRRPSGRA